MCRRMQEDIAESKAAVLQELQDLENQFLAAAEYTKHLECQIALHKHEAEDAKAAAFLHSEANSKLQALLVEHQAMWEKSFNFANKCDYLEQQKKEVEDRLCAEKKRYEELLRKADLQLIETKDGLQRTIETERKKGQQAEEQLVRKESEYRASMEEKNRRIEDLVRANEASKAEMELRERKWNEQFVLQESTLEEKDGELQQVRKEFQEATVLHEQQLQQVKTSYEEYLVQMTKRVNHGATAPGSGQDEYWRKKLMAQKQEYENKLEAAKKQIEALQKKEEDRQSLLQRNVAPPPPAGRGKRRKTNQYQLEVQ